MAKFCNYTFLGQKLISNSFLKSFLANVHVKVNIRDVGGDDCFINLLTKRYHEDFMEQTFLLAELTPSYLAILIRCSMLAFLDKISLLDR